MNNDQDAWEGLTWVLQLLPFSPYKAIKALNSYLNAEIGSMPDDRIIGIGQCISIIEAKFIYTNKGMENAILRLTPREFEWLIEILYQHIGYDTKLTPATRDGGKDIVAYIDREDGSEIVYVECKLYKTTELSIDTVRAFGYNIIKDNINRGVLFCTGYVNDRLKELDSRIQLWALEDIIILINAHIGADWEKRLGMLIDNQRRKYKK
jgi:restriction system protein